MRHRSSAVFFATLLFLSLFPPLEPRRGGGGGGLGGSRGGSGSRASSGGFGRSGGSSSSGSRGTFGGGGMKTGGRNEYSRGTNLNTNNRGATGGGWNSHSNSGGGWNNNNNMNKGGNSKGGFLGGLFGRSHGQSSHHSTFGGNRWSNSGIGSRSRGSTFKNMIVGAAAGYLTYQAGKAIIRAAAGPMMWNNRPYYWGSNYYRQSPGHTNMCRMPIDPTDSQFGNVYFQDQSRPREITWGCGYYEYCCGYECCRGGGSSGHIGTRGSSIGLILLVCAAFCCGFPLLQRWLRRRQIGNNV